MKQTILEAQHEEQQITTKSPRPGGNYAHTEHGNTWPPRHGLGQSTHTHTHTLKSRSYMPSSVWNSDEATSMPMTTCFVRFGFSRQTFGFATRGGGYSGPEERKKKKPVSYCTLPIYIKKNSKTGDKSDHRTVVDSIIVATNMISNAAIVVTTRRFGDVADKTKADMKPPQHPPQPKRATAGVDNKTRSACC